MCPGTLCVSPDLTLTIIREFSSISSLWTNEGSEAERFCDLPKVTQQHWKPSQAAKPRPLLLTHRGAKLSQEIRKIKVPVDAISYPQP